MLRSRLYILAIFMVVVLWGAGMAVPTMDPGLTAVTVSTRLTAEEADCIVGGNVGCWEVTKATYGDCVEANFDPENPKSAAAFIDCGAVGAWAGIACVATWVWNLFF